MLAKLSNPALLIGGLVWGLWAASNINSPAVVSVTPSGALETGKEVDTNALDVTSGVTSDDTLLALHATATPQDLKPASMSAHTPVESAASMTTRPRVIKVWLAQPSR
jgi:hypothetical protein